MTSRGRAALALGAATYLAAWAFGSRPLYPAAVGLLLVVFDRVPWLGRLPGDISIQRGSWTFYFPLGTSILLSIVLTLVLWLIGRR